jgi:hypothetical protein
MTRAVPGIVVAVLLAGAAPARAQLQWGDRGYAMVSGTFQPSSSFAETVRPIDFAEASLVDTGYKTGLTAGFDAGGGVRVWRNLAIGVDVSRFSKTVDASVSAQVPHPFFFNRARAVSGDASGVKRDEIAAHVQALWMMPLRNRLQVSIAAGPSWFNVGQDLVGDVTVTETYPFDTAAFAAATVVHRSRTRLGFNTAADLTYGLRPHLGVGIGVTFARASIPLDDTLTVTAGGAHVAAGLRFRF